MRGDVRRLTLDQIRAFVSIAEHQSFTSAARLQMRTQTALTRQIKSMEDVFGARLVRRSRGHVEGLTEAGQRLLPFAHRILATVDDAWTSLDGPALSGAIRVGIMDDIDVSWLNRLLAHFNVVHPECDVRAISDFSVRLERRLEAGEIDVAIIKQLGTDDRAPCEGLLRREPLVWVAGPGFRWEPPRPLPVVAFHEGCIYRGSLLRRLEDMGIATQVVYDGQSYSNVREAVFAGLGITVLAESQARAGGLKRLRQIGGRPLEDLGTVEIVVRCAKGRGSPVLRAFMREIERQMQERPVHAGSVLPMPESVSPAQVQIA